MSNETPTTQPRFYAATIIDGHAWMLPRADSDLACSLAMILSGRLPAVTWFYVSIPGSDGSDQETYQVAGSFYLPIEEPFGWVTIKEGMQQMCSPAVVEAGTYFLDTMAIVLGNEAPPKFSVSWKAEGFEWSFEWATDKHKVTAAFADDGSRETLTIVKHDGTETLISSSPKLMAEDIVIAMCYLADGVTGSVSETA